MLETLGAIAHNSVAWDLGARLD